jgi:DNA-binding PadR family transcriptional regulator
MATPEGQVSRELRENFTSFASLHSGYLKLAILKMISQRPMHGYALMKEVERMSEHTWKPSPGSVYPALKELQRCGYIVQELDGRKRVYRLTELGDVVLKEAIVHMERGVRSLQNILNYRPPGP